MSTYVLSKEKLREAGWEDLQKAAGHKYDSKYKKNGKWRYIYPNSGSRHGAHKTSKKRAEVKDEHLHAGASFAAGKEKGHYKIEKVEGGMVTFHHDDVDGKGTRGKSVTMSVKDFRNRANYERKGAVKEHAKEGLEKREAVLEKARKADPEGKMGYVARAEKELARWKEGHKEYLPIEKSKRVVRVVKKSKTAMAKEEKKAAKAKEPDKKSSKVDTEGGLLSDAGDTAPKISAEKKAELKTFVSEKQASLLKIAKEMKTATPGRQETLNMVATMHQRDIISVLGEALLSPKQLGRIQDKLESIGDSIGKDSALHDKGKISKEELGRRLLAHTTEHQNISIGLLFGLVGKLEGLSPEKESEKASKKMVKASKALSKKEEKSSEKPKEEPKKLLRATRTMMHLASQIDAHRQAIEKEKHQVETGGKTREEADRNIKWAQQQIDGLQNSLKRSAPKRDETPDAPKKYKTARDPKGRRV